MPSYSEIYTWVDENGKTHFSDKKHDGIEQEVITPDVQPANWERYKVEILIEDGVELTDVEKARIKKGAGLVYAFYDAKMHFDFYKTVPMKIHVFPDKKSYLEYTTQFVKINYPTNGMYIGNRHEIVVIRFEDFERTLEIIQHEMSHALCHALTFIPKWLNEGLAENMEALRSDENGLYIIPHQGNMARVKTQYLANSIGSLEEFLKLNSSEWMGNMEDGNIWFQSYSGELVRFLLSSSQGRSFIIKVIREYKYNKRKLAGYLVEEVYMGGMVTLQARFNRWVEAGDLGVIRL